MPTHTLKFKISFHLMNADDEETIKKVLNDILLFFNPFCNTIGARISYDYADEFVENDNHSHSVIYLTINKSFKEYVCAFHSNTVLISFCELIIHGGICASYKQKSNLQST